MKVKMMVPLYRFGETLLQTDTYTVRYIVFK